MAMKVFIAASNSSGVGMSGFQNLGKQNGGRFVDPVVNKTRRILFHDDGNLSDFLASS